MREHGRVADVSSPMFSREKQCVYSRISPCSFVYFGGLFRWSQRGVVAIVRGKAGSDGCGDTLFSSILGREVG